MTPFQDKLRAALRETADEIPDAAPPLRLPAPGRPSSWPGWAAPLVSGVLVIAVVAVSLAVAGGAKPPQAAAGPAGDLPPYYVALVTQQPGPDVYSLEAPAAEVRSTLTGAVLAKVTPPGPYTSFTGVAAAADDRTFVLSAQGPDDPPEYASSPAYQQEYPDGYYPAQGLFLLRIDPASASPGDRMSLRALPAGFVPANDAIHDMALSPNGTELAADVGGSHFTNDQLFVFNLTTGTERAWGVRTCAACFSNSGGLNYGGVNVDALSWTADGRHVAFVWGNTVRLLDTNDPGSNLLADSVTVAVWSVRKSPTTVANWRGAIITPDGQAVIAVEQLTNGEGSITVREHLVTFSAATGKATATLNNLDVLALNGYEQILYTNATGSILLLTSTRPGRNAAILDDGRYTPIPWSPGIGIAAW
jgi:hypothetical protein